MGMPTLYSERAAALGQAAERAALTTDPNLANQAARAEAVAAVPNALRTLFNNELLNTLQELKQHDRMALEGALHVGLSYAIGNAFNQTALLREGSTIKNAVPLMVKMNELAAITKTATTHYLRLIPPPPEFVARIALWFHTNVPQTNPDYWKEKYSVGPGVGASRSRIYGAGVDPVADTTAMLTNLLRGEGSLDLAAGSGKPLPEPDKPSGQIQHTVGSQKGMPMEYRWPGGSPTAPGELETLVHRILTEVRNANLAHLNDSDRAAILARLD